MSGSQVRSSRLGGLPENGRKKAVDLFLVDVKGGADSATLGLWICS
jgi:hypothetical protein